MCREEENEEKVEEKREEMGEERPPPWSSGQSSWLQNGDVL
jgi:hypothetical protein